METTSDKSTTFPLEDAITCYLEEDDLWSRRQFPRAEVCVVGAAFGGFLVITGLIMIVIHYTLETREGHHSMLEHMEVHTPFLGLAFLALAGALFLGTLFAYAVWKVMEVLEMAHRYREHKELCAYEEMRQSFRSQQGIARFDSSSSRCNLGSSRYSNK